MKKIYCTSVEAVRTELSQLFNRPAYPAEVESAAMAIIEDVRLRGDAAVIEYAKKFDKYDLTPETMMVTAEEVSAEISKLSISDRRAIDVACSQIKTFAKLVRPVARKWKVRPGVTVGEKFTPLDRVGVYIPGGTAPLVSTVIHTAGIAAAAGVREIVAVTPPHALNPATLYAMKRAGVTEIYRLGGVYAVAALAWGTATIRKVDKIAGPGNAYVTAAKKLLFGRVSIDLVAGPSEILVIADESANPKFIAADLLSQAEHGSGFEQSVLITTDRGMIERVEHELLRQKKLLERESIIDKVLDRGIFLIYASDMNIALNIANSYAPEHMELQVRNPRQISHYIKAAGAIFLGHWTPEPIGDFCAGPSHVLPTASSAKRFNGLSTVDFMRRSSIVEYSEAALKREVPIVERFGAMEHLGGHAASGTCRIKK